MPTQTPDRREELTRVMKRLEDETQRAASAHLLVGEKASIAYKVLGVTATALAAAGSAAGFRDLPLASGIVGALVAALTAVITFLNLVEKTKLHARSRDDCTWTSSIALGPIGRSTPRTTASHRWRRDSR
jgi:hypothetical protein